jgi:2-oxoglutarate ferredoxin oxidoreductase subunit alpha
VDLMTLSFELAEKYRNPVMICADGMIGQMMEPVEFPTEGRGEPMAENDWALTGCEGRERRIVNSLYLAPEDLNDLNLKLKAKYDRMAKEETRYELFGAEDGYDVLVTAFGTMARICKTAIHELQQEGHKVALFRPITLNPFPYEACREAIEALPPDGIVLDVEMNMGQMLYDVRLANEGARHIEFHGSAGGVVPSPDDVVAQVKRLLEPEAVAAE